MEQWDYIIVGAGSAGCVLANRLSADPANKVLLLEAGGSDNSAKFKVPILGPMMALGNPATDWMLPTEPDPSRMDRQEFFPRGKVLGGSSAINGTIYVRGNRGDYDHWAQLGNKGWDYDSLIPVFQRMEDGIGPLASGRVYGRGGPMKISEVAAPHPLTHRFLAAMEELGVPANPDYNGETQTGSSITHVTQKRGRRWSSARGYLDPARKRPNLRIVTTATVRRILIEGKRAVGVEFDQDGRRQIERCSGEIVLSAGPFNSPKLLMLSGIGDPDHLRAHGIAVVHGNSGVGRNFQEHAVCAVKAYVSAHTVNMDNNLSGLLRNGFRYMFMGSGPACSIFPALSFVKLSPQADYPDLQFHFGALIFDLTPDGVKMLDRPGITIQPNVNRTRSRGHVRLKSADPMTPPEIQPNMLSDPYDLETLVAGVKMARGLLRTKAFSPVFQGEHAPNGSVTSDSDLEDFVRATAAPCYHASGTAKMGIDEQAVVNPSLKVIGIDGLRVADSSIIPQLPCGNINALSMLIGEKGADAILTGQ